MSSRNDIVIFCAHGKTNAEDGDFLQRFRWTDREDTWIATKTGGDRVEYYGSRPGPYLDEEDVAASIGSGPPHFNLRCQRCGDHVAMSGVRAQRTLTKLSNDGYSSPLPLAALRYVYEKWAL